MLVRYLIKSSTLVLAILCASSAIAAGPATQPIFQTPTLNVPKLIATTQPRMDASADDPAWANAAVISALPLCAGKQGAGMSPTPTQVRIMWDEANLFVRFRNVDATIYAPHGKATDVLHSDGDVSEIFIDPVGDQRQYFELQCNPVGGWVDGLHVLSCPQQPTSDAEGVLTSDILKRDVWFAQNYQIKGLRIAGAEFTDGSEHGWIADFALPAGPILQRLARSKYGPMNLRINFIRYDVNGPPSEHPAPAIDMAWSPVQWGRPHRSPALMGTIVLTQ